MNSNGNSIPAIPATTQPADLITAINDRIRRLAAQSAAAGTTNVTEQVTPAAPGNFVRQATPPASPTPGQGWLDSSKPGRGDIRKIWQLTAEGGFAWVAF